jgi:hypothetical protein
MHNDRLSSIALVFFIIVIGCTAKPSIISEQISEVSLPVVLENNNTNSIIEISSANHTPINNIFLKLDQISLSEEQLKFAYLKEDNHLIFAETEQNSEINITGTLVNNGSSELKEIYLQLRFYNRNNEDKPLELYGYKLERDVVFTNKYVNYNRQLFYNGSSQHGFPANLESPIKIRFDGLPDWKDDVYNSEELEKNKYWKHGLYDVDRAELNLYHGTEKIQTLEIPLSEKYTHNVRLDIIAMDFTNVGVGDKLYAFNYNISNIGLKTLTAPRLIIDVKKLSDEYQPKEIDVISKEIKLNFSLYSGSSFSQRQYDFDLGKVFMSNSGTNKGYIIYFRLYDGNSLVDIEPVLINCKSDTCIPKNKKQRHVLIDNVPIPQYGYGAIIEEAKKYVSLESGANYQVNPLGVNVAIRLTHSTYYGGPKLNRPVLDLFCETTTMSYEIQDDLYQGYDVYLKIPFPYAQCNKVVANLRDDNNPMVYAASYLTTKN